MISPLKKLPFDYTSFCAAFQETHLYSLFKNRADAARTRAERASYATTSSEKAEKYIDTVSEWGHNIEKAARRSVFVRAGGNMDRTEKCGKKFAELFGGKPVKDEGTDPEFMRSFSAR